MNIFDSARIFMQFLRCFRMQMNFAMSKDGGRYVFWR